MKTVPGIGNQRYDLLARLFTPDGRPKEGLEGEKPLSSSEVAVLFQMTERSIRKLASEGRLPHMRTLGGGRILYPPREIAVLYVEISSNSGLKMSQRGT